MLESSGSLELVLSYANSLIYKIPKFIDNVVIQKGKIVLLLESDNISLVMYFLKMHTSNQYNVLVDITALDRLSQKNRFEIYYFLRSTLFNTFLTIKILNDGYSPVSSVVSTYKGAGWLEREIWDMFGIFFSDHQDLRRILTDYGFQGFPLRKDFPLTGFIEVRYDDESKRVSYDLLELTQEFRFFDFQSPWQNSEFFTNK
jgi:NADH:ubiquinone oxidoreductase subunit C